MLTEWGLASPDRVETPERGTNNQVRLVNIGATRYVLRIHQNSSPDMVEREHRLLTALAADPALDLAVPAPLPTPDGRTLVGAGGELSSVSRYLPGERPTKADPGLVETASAIGRLTAALGRLPKAFAPIDWSGRRLDQIHPAVDDVDDLVAALRRELPSEPGVDWLAEHVRASDEMAARLENRLPCQIIHGDQSLSNLLRSDGRITAVLDFEIAGWDLRVNELVVAVVQICDAATDPTGPEEVRDLHAGFSRHVQLTDEELDAMPLLARRRALGTVVWRAGRWRRGQASLEDVRDRLRDGLRIESNLAAFRPT